MANYDLTMQTGSSFTKTFLIKRSDGTVLNLDGYVARMYVVTTPGTLASTVFSSTAGDISLSGATGLLTVTLTPAQVNAIVGNFYKIEVEDVNGYQTVVVTGNLFLLDETRVGVEYLTTILRLRLGDTNPLAYRYSDEWLKVSLIAAVKLLQRWWDARYTITDSGVVSRSTLIYFETDVATEGVIEKKDELIIVLMATYIILQGSLENSAWDLVSWKDAEVSYNSNEGGRVRDRNLDRLWSELMSYLTPPSKKLARPVKGSLPGYLNNTYERDTDY